MSEVKIPTNAEEAAAMALVGMSWLEQNAPEKLTELYREIRAEAGRAGFVAGANWWARCELCDELHLDENNAANHYADSIRQEKK